MYEDLYKGMSPEEYERFLKADIPKFVIIGYREITPEEKREAEEFFKTLQEKRNHSE